MYLSLYVYERGANVEGVRLRSLGVSDFKPA